MQTFLSEARRIESACGRGEVLPDMLSDAFRWWLYTHQAKRLCGERPAYRCKATLTEILVVTERQGRLEAGQDAEPPTLDPIKNCP